ncbi:MAG: DUF5667 domain-containing protein, partial [Chloroflexota bacterium]
LEKVLTGELTREEAAEQAPEMEDRLLLLTGLTDELRSLPQHAPDPDFRNRTRMRLLQHIQETQQRRRWWQRVLEPVHGLPGWASTMSAVVIASGGLTFGASYASASALPDDRLYPVKRAVEHVQVAMASSDEAKANTYLDLADRRAAEIAATAGDLDELKLQGLTRDYGNALQNVTVAVQTLSAPSMPLLDKVQAHVASQATELEARALNSSSRPVVQEQLVQAEVVASNTVDHVTLVAEKSGKPGAQDVHLAANAPAAATAAAATTPLASLTKPASPSPSADPTAAPTKAPVGVLGPAVDPAASSPAAAPASAPSTPSANLDGQFDQLWNQVAAAPFMGQRVRSELEVDVANAKQDAHTGRKDAAIADMNAFVVQLQAAVNAHQATQFTSTRLSAEAKAILAALQSTPAGQLGIRASVTR